MQTSKRRINQSLGLGPALGSALLISTMTSAHLHDELAQTNDRVVVETRFGPVTGGRSKNGAAVFLGRGTICYPASVPDTI
jgi:hypothetical protein